MATSLWMKPLLFPHADPAGILAFRPDPLEGARSSFAGALVGQVVLLTTISSQKASRVAVVEFRRQRRITRNAAPLFDNG